MKENGLKLGRKLGGGLARDGPPSMPRRPTPSNRMRAPSWNWKGGFIPRSEAEVVADGKPMPKQASGEATDKGEWFGKKVLPRRDPKTIRIGDWIDGKQEYWTPHDLANSTVREDRSGFLRLYDGRREGWLGREDMVTAEEAPAWWDRAVEQSPNDAYGWVMRGMSWDDRGENDNAIKDDTEAIRLSPSDGTAYCNRSDVWVKKKEYDKAIADCTEALRIDSNDAMSCDNRGTARSAKREYDSAIADFTEALRIDSKLRLAYYNRGNASGAKRAYDKAIADCTETLRTDPKFAFAYGNRGLAFTMTNRFAEAGKDFERALELQPADWIYRACSQFGSTCPDGKYRDGMRALEMAKKAAEMAEDPNCHYHSALASAYVETGDFERLSRPLDL